MCLPCGWSGSPLSGLSPVIDRRLAYSTARGSGISVGAIGSRPARVPLFFAAPIGATSSPSVPVQFIDPIAAYNQWSLTVSGAKALPSPSRNFGLSLVGDLFVPVIGKASGAPIGPSPTVRAGVKIDY